MVWEGYDCIEKRRVNGKCERRTEEKEIEKEVKEGREEGEN